jgi:flavin reductase (DIM6/NTAB) family NADH-FMN oxidoreductase RutF
MTAFDLQTPRIPASPVDAPGVAADLFRESLARLASGLAIVTCRRDGRDEGLLVSSITGLSVEPPRFLFCVRREASAYEALVAAHVCGVNILSSDDEDEARLFMDPLSRAQRFSGAGWRREPTHPPLLQTALSTATCLVDSVIEAGGHSIVVVTAQTLNQRAGAPLLAYNRGLHRLEAARRSSRRASV